MTESFPKIMHIKFNIKNIYKLTCLVLVFALVTENICAAQGGAPAASAAPNTNLVSASISVPKELGQATKISHIGKETIINIQDAHASLDAQKSIAKMLHRITEDYEINLVGLEGSEGPVDTGILSSYPDKTVRQKTAESLLAETKISAGEFFKIVSGDEETELYGAEDSKLYRKNLEIFQKLLEAQPIISLEIKKLESLERIMKEKIFSPETVEFFSKSSHFEKGDISFDKYWQYLERLFQKYSVSYQGSANLKIISQTLSLEKKIDFRLAEKERDRLISEMKDKTDSKTVEQIVLKALKLKSGKLDAAEFYRFLIQTAKDHDIAVTKENYQNLLNYFEYIRLFDSVAIFDVLNELETAHEKVKDRLLLTEDQKKLGAFIKNSKIYSQLLQGQVTGKEWNYYESYSDQFDLNKINSYIAAFCGNFEIPVSEIPDLESLMPYLKISEDFYRFARMRDKVLLENTLRRMREKAVHKAVLITGGFHTDGLSDWMSQKQVSHIVIMPKFDSSQKERPYAAVITQKGSYLDNELKKQEQLKSVVLLIGLSVLGGTSLDEAKKKYLESYQKRRPKAAFRINQAGGSDKTAGLDYSPKNVGSNTITPSGIFSSLAGFDAAVQVVNSIIGARRIGPNLAIAIDSKLTALRSGVYVVSAGSTEIPATVSFESNISPDSIVTSPGNQVVALKVTPDSVVLNELVAQAKLAVLSRLYKFSGMPQHQISTAVTREFNQELERLLRRKEIYPLSSVEDSSGIIANVRQALISEVTLKLAESQGASAVITAQPRRGKQSSLPNRQVRASGNSQNFGTPSKSELIFVLGARLTEDSWKSFFPAVLASMLALLSFSQAAVTGAAPQISNKNQGLVEQVSGIWNSQNSQERKKASSSEIDEIAKILKDRSPENQSRRIEAFVALSKIKGESAQENKKIADLYSQTLKAFGRAGSSKAQAPNLDVRSSPIQWSSNIVQSVQFIRAKLIGFMDQYLSRGKVDLWMSAVGAASFIQSLTEDPSLDKSDKIKILQGLGDPLRDALLDEDPMVRAAAAHALSLYGMKVKNIFGRDSAIQPLVQILEKDNSEEARFAAALALGSVRADSRDFLAADQAIVKALSNPNEKSLLVKAALMEAAASYGLVSASGLIVQAVTDLDLAKNDNQAQYNQLFLNSAFSALEKLGGKNSGNYEKTLSLILSVALRNSNRPEFINQRIVAMASSLIFAGGPSGGQLEKSRAEFNAFIEELRSKLRLSPSVKSVVAVESVVSEIGSLVDGYRKNYDAKMAADKELFRFGQMGLTGILNGGADPGRRALAAYALGLDSADDQTSSISVLENVIQTLDDENPEVQKAALLALTRLNYGGLIVTNDDSLVKKIGDLAVRSKDGDLQLIALYALSQIGDSAVVTYSNRLISDNEIAPLVRSSAIKLSELFHASSNSGSSFNMASLNALITALAPDDLKWVDLRRDNKALGLTERDADLANFDNVRKVSDEALNSLDRHFGRMTNEEKEIFLSQFLARIKQETSEFKLATFFTALNLFADGLNDSQKKQFTKKIQEQLTGERTDMRRYAYSNFITILNAARKVNKPQILGSLALIQTLWFDTDPEQRIEAAIRLGQAASFDWRIAAAFKTAFLHEHDSRVLEAISLVFKKASALNLGLTRPGAAEEFSKLLKEAIAANGLSSKEKIIYIKFLGSLEDPKSIETIVSLISDSNTDVVVAALNELRTYESFKVAGFVERVFEKMDIKSFFVPYGARKDAADQANKKKTAAESFIYFVAQGLKDDPKALIRLIQYLNSQAAERGKSDSQSSFWFKNQINKIAPLLNPKTPSKNETAPKKQRNTDSLVTLSRPLDMTPSLASNAPESPESLKSMQNRVMDRFLGLFKGNKAIMTAVLFFASLFGADSNVIAQIPDDPNLAKNERIYNDPATNFQSQDTVDLSKFYDTSNEKKFTPSAWKEVQKYKATLKIYFEQNPDLAEKIKKLAMKQSVSLAEDQEQAADKNISPDDLLLAVQKSNDMEIASLAAHFLGEKRQNFDYFKEIIQASIVSKESNMSGSMKPSVQLQKTALIALHKINPEQFDRESEFNRSLISLAAFSDAIEIQRLALSLMAHINEPSSYLNSVMEILKTNTYDINLKNETVRQNQSNLDAAVEQALAMMARNGHSSEVINALSAVIEGLKRVNPPTQISQDRANEISGIKARIAQKKETKRRIALAEEDQIEVIAGEQNDFGVAPVEAVTGDIAGSNSVVLANYARPNTHDDGFDVNPASFRRSKNNPISAPGDNSVRAANKSIPAALTALERMYSREAFGDSGEVGGASELTSLAATDTERGGLEATNSSQLKKRSPAKLLKQPRASQNDRPANTAIRADRGILDTILLSTSVEEKNQAAAAIADPKNANPDESVIRPIFSDFNSNYSLQLQYLRALYRFDRAQVQGNLVADYPDYIESLKEIFKKSTGALKYFAFANLIKHGQEYGSDMIKEVMLDLQNNLKKGTQDPNSSRWHLMGFEVVKEELRNNPDLKAHIFQLLKENLRDGNSIGFLHTIASALDPDGYVREVASYAPGLQTNAERKARDWRNETPEKKGWINFDIQNRNGDIETGSAASNELRDFIAKQNPNYQKISEQDFYVWFLDQMNTADAADRRQAIAVALKFLENESQNLSTLDMVSRAEHISHMYLFLEIIHQFAGLDTEVDAIAAYVVGSFRTPDSNLPQINDIRYQILEKIMKSQSNQSFFVVANVARSLGTFGKRVKVITADQNQKSVVYGHDERAFILLLEILNPQKGYLSNSFVFSEAVRSAQEFGDIRLMNPLLQLLSEKVSAYSGWEKTKVTRTDFELVVLDDAIKTLIAKNPTSLEARTNLQNAFKLSKLFAGYEYSFLYDYAKAMKVPVFFFSFGWLALFIGVKAVIFVSFLAALLLLTYVIYWNIGSTKMRARKILIKLQAIREKRMEAGFPFPIAEKVSLPSAGGLDHEISLNGSPEKLRMIFPSNADPIEKITAIVARWREVSDQNTPVVFEEINNFLERTLEDYSNQTRIDFNKPFNVHKRGIEIAKLQAILKTALVLAYREHQAATDSDRIKWKELINNLSNYYRYFVWYSSFISAMLALNRAYRYYRTVGFLERRPFSFDKQMALVQKSFLNDDKERPCILCHLYESGHEINLDYPNLQNSRQRSDVETEMTDFFDQLKADANAKEENRNGKWFNPADEVATPESMLDDQRRKDTRRALIFLAVPGISNALIGSLVPVLKSGTVSSGVLFIIFFTIISSVAGVVHTLLHHRRVAVEGAMARDMEVRAALSELDNFDAIFGDTRVTRSSSSKNRTEKLLDEQINQENVITKAIEQGSLDILIASVSTKRQIDGVNKVLDNRGVDQDKTLVIFAPNIFYANSKYSGGLISLLQALQHLKSGQTINQFIAAYLRDSKSLRLNGWLLEAIYDDTKKQKAKEILNRFIEDEYEKADSELSRLLSENDLDISKIPALEKIIDQNRTSMSDINLGILNFSETQTHQDIFEPSGIKGSSALKDPDQTSKVLFALNDLLYLAGLAESSRNNGWVISRNTNSYRLGNGIGLPQRTKRFAAAVVSVGRRHFAEQTLTAFKLTGVSEIKGLWESSNTPDQDWRGQSDGQLKQYLEKQLGKKLNGKEDDREIQAFAAGLWAADIQDPFVNSVAQNLRKLFIRYTAQGKGDLIKSLSEEGILTITNFFLQPRIYLSSSDRNNRDLGQFVSVLNDLAVERLGNKIDKQQLASFLTEVKEIFQNASAQLTPVQIMSGDSKNTLISRGNSQQLRRWATAYGFDLRYLSRLNNQGSGASDNVLLMATSSSRQSAATGARLLQAPIDSSNNLVSNDLILGISIQGGSPDQAASKIVEILGIINALSSTFTLNIKPVFIFSKDARARQVKQALTALSPLNKEAEFFAGDNQRFIGKYGNQSSGVSFVDAQVLTSLNSSQKELALAEIVSRFQKDGFSLAKADMTRKMKTMQPDQKWAFLLRLLGSLGPKSFEALKVIGSSALVDGTVLNEKNADTAKTIAIALPLLTENNDQVVSRTKWIQYQADMLKEQSNGKARVLLLVPQSIQYDFETSNIFESLRNSMDYAVLPDEAFASSSQIYRQIKDQFGIFAADDLVVVGSSDSNLLRDSDDSGFVMRVDASRSLGMVALAAYELVLVKGDLLKLSSRRAQFVLNRGFYLYKPEPINIDQVLRELMGASHSTHSAA